MDNKPRTPNKKRHIIGSLKSRRTFNSVSTAASILSANSSIKGEDETNSSRKKVQNVLQKNLYGVKSQPLLHQFIPDNNISQTTAKHSDNNLTCNSFNGSNNENIKNSNNENAGCTPNKSIPTTLRRKSSIDMDKVITATYTNSHSEELTSKIAPRNKISYNKQSGGRPAPVKERRESMQATKESSYWEENLIENISSADEELHKKMGDTKLLDKQFDELTDNIVIVSYIYIYIYILYRWK